MILIKALCLSGLARESLSYGNCLDSVTILGFTSKTRVVNQDYDRMSYLWATLWRVWDYRWSFQLSLSPSPVHSVLNAQTPETASKSCLIGLLAQQGFFQGSPLFPQNPNNQSQGISSPASSRAWLIWGVFRNAQSQVTSQTFTQNGPEQGNSGKFWTVTEKNSKWYTRDVR